jgi:hypothetical protein
MGLHPTGAFTHTHRKTNMSYLSKKHARGQAAEPPNKYQKYFLGRLRGYCQGRQLGTPELSP